MAEIINLRRARKTQERSARNQEAEQNRRRFGQTKGEKNAEAQRRERMERALEGHRRNTDKPD